MSSVHKLHVHVTGHGDDLVLLHGWAMHGGVFAELLPTLAQRHRVHVIDLPGHGLSAFDVAIGKLDSLADIVRPHVPNNALVLGWSLGGLLALKLAQLQTLRGVVLTSTTPRFVADASWPHGMAQPVFTQFFAKLQQNLRVTVQDFLALQVRGDSDAAHTLKALQEVLLKTPGDDAALRLGLQILRDADERRSLSGIQVPTLVIAGEYDRITHPKASQYLASQLPQARYVEIKRAGHAPFISHREQFVTEVNQFLTSLDAAVGKKEWTS
jgi:pimeloyl-[acyl-carrier protein] methyl ester esterase